MLVLAAGCTSENDVTQQPGPGRPVPAVEAFLASRPDLGVVQSVEAMPDSEDGQRQQVRTTRGEYVFELAGGELVTVYRNDPSGRTEVWRKP